MHSEATYINVILPLKIEWEPCYSTFESELSVGSRVRVPFSGKEYIGVVSEVGITPDIELKKIRQITCVESGMDRILESEIKFWRSIAQYYLCTVGEVYKAAYPSIKLSKEVAAAVSAEKSRLRQIKAQEQAREKALDAISKLSRRIEAKTAQAENARTESTRLKYQAELKQLNEKLLEKKSILESSEECIADIETSTEKKVEFKESPILSEAQTTAYNSIRKAFSEKKTALIQGVTGSGKTEIYITLALQALKSGRNVLYLVPEIALSRQLQDRLEEAFGDALLCFHSAESAASKRDTASAIRHRTEPYIILGTRSSLFLPHHDLGLIIVDEEHDSSYKQEDPAPRYNAREASIMLGHILGSNIILGTATPSLESLYNCSVGKFAYIELSERYYSADDAEIEIIDTIEERKKRGMVGSFSRKLIERINRNLESGGQTILLRARRAYAPTLQCDSCGEIIRCTRCNVPLSLHNYANGQKMVCHYCGHTEPYTGTCPKCQGEIKQIGAGTQKIEEEATKLFPTARIARLDSDSAKAAGYEKKTIKDFSEGKTDILIGTQIVTKGFDFQNLTLVAVLQADGILAQADFRADERATQTLAQFRGRCSRRGQKGLFVIQTCQGDHPVYTSLTDGTATKAMSLLQERKMFGYPPYTRMVGIIIKDSNQGRIRKLSYELAEKIRKAVPCQVTGPYAPTVDKLYDQWIMHIRIPIPKDRNLVGNKNLIAKTVSTFEKESSYIGHIHIDVDPA